MVSIDKIRELELLSNQLDSDDGETLVEGVVSTAGKFYNYLNQLGVDRKTSVQIVHTMSDAGFSPNLLNGQVLQEAMSMNSARMVHA